MILNAGAVHHPHHAELRERDSLTHLDGLHRMQAWDCGGGCRAFVDRTPMWSA